MKRICALTAAAAMVLSAALFAGCGKSEFTANDFTEKEMVIIAENAAKDSMFEVGTLTVEEGEKISMTADLKKGEILVEIIEEPENQSIDELPDLDRDPILSSKMKNSDAVSGGMPAGSYSVRATCLEKATGTIVVEVVPGS